MKNGNKLPGNQLSCWPAGRRTLRGHPLPEIEQSNSIKFTYAGKWVKMRHFLLKF